MLRLSQEMRLTQKLDVRMIQSLKLLPLTTMQLEQRIHQELEQNPMLQVEELEEQVKDNTNELVDKSGQVKTSSMETGEDGDFSESEWLKYIQDRYNSGYRVRQEYDPNVEERESIHTYIDTLGDNLIEQLGLTVRNERDRHIGEFIIGCINDDGYLELTDEEIAVDANIPVEDIRRLISIIQQFEPTGVGARNLQESLLIQLQEKGQKDSIAWNVIKKHFSDLTNRRFKNIMRTLLITEENLKKAIDVIASLTLRPGAVFKDTSNTSVIPDIIVEKIEDEYEVMLNDKNGPRLTISSGYRRLLDKKMGTPPEARKYLVDKLNSAKWFINSIEQRRSTILRVSKTIVDRQKDFLEQGISFLKPMTLQDIAESIGVAISTVQRVTSGKYIQTPRGVFELKYFFTQRISSSDGSEDLSAKTVKDKLAKLIEVENPQKPLSDQKITDILNNDGVAISRRAIAKYRDELQISPARFRKQL